MLKWFLTALLFGPITTLIVYGIVRYKQRPKRIFLAKALDSTESEEYKRKG